MRLLIVPRGALRVASWQKFQKIPTGQSGRLQLADWLLDERNPLTARLTRRHLGRVYRLTDVYGSMVKEILS